MKKQYLLSLFLGLLLLHSCNEVPIHNAITCLSTAPSAEEQYLSSVFDSCKIIRLETTDDALVGGYIGKIKKTQDAYYMACDFNFLLKFDKDGKFLQKIMKLGNGPGEYNAIRSYDILPNGDFIICDVQRAHVYDRDWNHKKTVSLGVYGFDIRTVDEDKFLLCTMSGEYLVYLFDLDGNVLSKLIETENLPSTSSSVSLLFLGKNHVIQRIGNSNSLVCYDINTGLFSDILFLCDGNFMTNEEEMALKKQQPTPNEKGLWGESDFMGLYPATNIITRTHACEDYLVFRAGSKSNGLKNYLLNSHSRKIEHVFTNKTVNDLYFLPTSTLMNRLYNSSAPDCFITYAGVDEIQVGLDKNSALQESKQYRKLKQELAGITNPEDENPVLIELYVK
ncbi:MAG: 6-bladed beta-propeller [Tannerella sp.]|jgi:hypothetical protein|nr:6-bladed beta-propeller [Tannerella sp.]